jgi:hypothetical protein
MKEWIPFLQTIAWIALISVLITVYRRKISVILDAVSRRIAEGSSLKVGPVEIGELKTELSQVRHELDEANDKIQKLFLATMAPPMFENLKKLTQNSFGEYTMSSGLERELYHLR